MSFRNRNLSDAEFDYSTIRNADSRVGILGNPRAVLPLAVLAAITILVIASGLSS